jgi:hypothetical protein
MTVKRPTNACKRDLLMHVKTPTNAWKESYECLERELLTAAHVVVSGNSWGARHGLPLQLLGHRRCVLYIHIYT